LRQRVLDRLEELGLDDRRMQTGIGLLLMLDLATIVPVLQQVVEGAAAKPQTAHGPPAAGHPGLGANALRVEFCFEGGDRAKLQVALEDPADDLGLGLVDDEDMVAGIIAKRQDAAHPESLGLGGGDLVADLNRHLFGID
jgi:hypothetical protein